MLQVTFDANDPRALAGFWEIALDGYVYQPPPEGFDTWEQFGAAVGIPEDRWDAFAALVRDGHPRIFFQKVPEGKTAKNRVHLDINVSHDDPDGWDAAVAHADRLVAAGATMLREVDEPAGRCLVLTDPEGNEFCVQ